MEYIKVFTSRFLESLGQRLQSEDTIDRYINGKSPSFSSFDVKDTTIKMEELPKLNANLSVFENARILYESLRGIDLTLASDQRLWAWLANVPFMDYMAKLWPVADQPKEDRAKYIARHWFVDSQRGRSYLRNSIALLWWGAHMTYDEKRDDPFELTKEFFEYYQDSTIFGDSLGRSELFTRSLLDFIIKNQKHFEGNKRQKIRELVRRLNFVGASRILPTLDETELNNIFKELIN